MVGGVNVHGVPGMCRSEFFHALERDMGIALAKSITLPMVVLSW